MIAFALAVVVLVAALFEFAAWLRYPGGGTQRVPHAEIKRIEEVRQEAL